MTSSVIYTRPSKLRNHEPGIFKQHSLDSKLSNGKEDYYEGFLSSMSSMPNLKVFDNEENILNDCHHNADAIELSNENSPRNSTIALCAAAPSHEAPARLYNPPSPRMDLPTNRNRAHSIDSGSNVKTFCLLDTNRGDVMNSDLPSLVAKSDAGLKGGVEPILAEGAMGGSYFLRDKSRAIQLVFKPSDEEPHAPNNPHEHNAGNYGTAYKGRIVPGFGMYRELAAYALDVGGFIGVVSS